MADSIMLRPPPEQPEPLLWTQDRDFKDIEGVRYVDAP